MLDLLQLSNIYIAHINGWIDREEFNNHHARLQERECLSADTEGMGGSDNCLPVSDAGVGGGDVRRMACEVVKHDD